MKKYFRYFAIPFIIVGIFAVVSIGIYISKGTTERTNTQSDLTNNVFDYADKLTASQEAALEAQIDAAENKLHYDIAVIILDETLEGYSSKEPKYWVMDYADDFADNHKMGYDKAYGDSVVFIDNTYREPRTGKVYSWISTSGRAMSNMPQSTCENIMDEGLYYLTDSSSADDYFDAYSKVISLLKSSGSSELLQYFQPLYIVLASLLIAIIYVLINWRSKLGTRTTVSTTYVENGRPNITHKTDVFLRKSVTKRKIQKSSGGSGGHMSSGGHSHGGGGHSR